MPITLVLDDEIANRLLIHTAATGNLRIVSALLDAGVDPCKFGEMALEVARDGGHKSTARAIHDAIIRKRLAVRPAHNADKSSLGPA